MKAFRLKSLSARPVSMDNTFNERIKTYYCIMFLDFLTKCTELAKFTQLFYNLGSGVGYVYGGDPKLRAWLLYWDTENSISLP
jgi:hypothetical protein